MPFNSLEFFVFAAIFFPVYFASRGQLRHVALLTANYFFYGWWDWRFLGLLMAITIVNFAVGRALCGDAYRKHRKALLAVSVCFNLGLLSVFKYLGFFSESFAALLAEFGLHASWTTLNIILPVGISFYVFQAMSYSIDVYRGRCAPEPSLLRFANYIALFPQLVAGPIVRARLLLPQLREDARFDVERVISGLELVAWGFFLKLALADTLSLLVDPAYEHPEAYGALGHAIAAFFFAFQIYGDFAGYSLIAIGLGRIMGFDFGENFRRPYLAAGFSEFWRRWHISLSSWLRDYLYIPLGGNRHGSLRTIRNLFATMLLGGLWHGAAWTFVAWGFLHGLYLTLWSIGERAGERLAPAGGAVATALMRLALIPVVFVLVCVAWVFFRADSIADALLVLSVIGGLRPAPDLVATDKFILLKGFLMIGVVMAVDIAAEFEAVCAAWRRSRAMRLAAIVLTCWGIALFGTFDGGAFIYFQF